MSDTKTHESFTLIPFRKSEQRPIFYFLNKIIIDEILISSVRIMLNIFFFYLMKKQLVFFRRKDTKTNNKNVDTYDTVCR